MDQFMDPFFETFRFSSVLLHSRRGEFLSTRSVIIQRIKRRKFSSRRFAGWINDGGGTMLIIINDGADRRGKIGSM